MDQPAPAANPPTGAGGQMPPPQPPVLVPGNPAAPAGSPPVMNVEVPPAPPQLSGVAPPQGQPPALVPKQVESEVQALLGTTNRWDSVPAKVGIFLAGFTLATLLYRCAPRKDITAYQQLDQANIV